jgi:hypothetical protein
MPIDLKSTRESMLRHATISDCGKFRYRLFRKWGCGSPLLFVMLNPSTADGEKDDATIRRCLRFAMAHDFGELEVVNLFAYRATDPKELRRAGYPVGPENDQHITDAVREAAAVCLAWGSNAAGLERPAIDHDWQWTSNRGWECFICGAVDETREPPAEGAQP